MNTEHYAETNRAAWNEVTPIHQKHRKTNLKEAVQSPSFSVLDTTETALLQRLGVKDKAVAQFCCNNGRELLSVVKMGASSGTGFDISDEAINEGQALAALAQVDCTFVRTNIFALDDSYTEQFDLVYITAGALTWFDDLERFFFIVANTLKKNGQLFIYEMHPFFNMMALPGEEAFDADNDLKVAYSYFKEEPWIDNNGLDYVGGTTYDAKTTCSFSHNFTAIFSGILNSGLALQEFKEYPHDICASFQYLEQHQKIPMCYTLIAQKPIS